MKTQTTMPPVVTTKTPKKALPEDSQMSSGLKPLTKDNSSSEKSKNPPSVGNKKT